MPFSEKNLKVFIATPCYGGNLHYQYVMSLLSFISTLKNRNIGYKIAFLGNESLVTRARNILVGKFLSDPECTHLFFIDSDIQFPVESAVKLLHSNKSVCFGVYPSKRIDFHQLEKDGQTTRSASEMEALCLNYMLSFEKDADNRFIIDREKKLIRSTFGTTGFMMIKREVFYKMASFYRRLQYENETTRAVHNIKKGNLYLFFDCIKDPETNDYLSEDFSFSLLWRKIGGSIWADMESRLTHWGNYKFQGDLETFLNQNKLLD